MGLSVENRHRGYDDAEVLWKFFEQESERIGTDVFAALGALTIKTTKKAAVKNTDQTSLF
jgi:hypothetical protein